MTETELSVEPTPAATAPRSQWADIWDQFKNHRGAMWGAGIFLFIVVMVLFGPFVYWNDPVMIYPRECWRTSLLPGWESCSFSFLRLFFRY